MKTQWQIYKELELIPDSISEQANQSVIKRITQVWHVIFEAKPPVIQSQEQKVEHLERCFDLRADAYELEHSQVWSQCKSVIEQFLHTWAGSTNEPQVWQSLDKSGKVQWHTYHPRTGRKVDFDSEDEVCVWIEESFYH